MILLSLHLNNEDTNMGAIDESKITQDRHSMPITTQTSITHLLHALMIKTKG